MAFKTTDSLSTDQNQSINDSKFLVETLPRKSFAFHLQASTPLNSPFPKQPLLTFPTSVLLLTAFNHVTSRSDNKVSRLCHNCLFHSTIVAIFLTAQRSFFYSRRPVVKAGGSSEILSLETDEQSPPKMV